MANNQPNNTTSGSNTASASTSRTEDQPSSPYYLHPNENLSLILVSPSLTGPNYHYWSRAMKMALLSKNKLQFVDGTITVPASTDSVYSAWQRCNTMVLSWIIKVVSPSIAQSIIWLDNACDVWKDLKDRFSQGDSFRISDLQQEIFSHQRGDASVTDYFTQLKILWDELLNLRPIPVCSCDPVCKCGAFDAIRKHHENDYVIRFLKGLNENYATVRSHIMLMEPLPPINKVFALVTQHERQLINPKSVSQESVAFASKSVMNQNQRSQHSGSNTYQNKKFFNSSYKKPLCTFCGYLGHTIDKCYKKHGYPPGFNSGFRPRFNSGFNSNFRPSIANANQVETNVEFGGDYHSESGVDHSAAQTQFRVGNYHSAGTSYLQSGSMANNQMTQYQGSSSVAGNFPFTQEQCQQLLGLLQQPQLQGPSNISIAHSNALSSAPPKHIASGSTHFGDDWVS